MVTHIFVPCNHHVGIKVFSVCGLHIKYFPVNISARTITVSLYPFRRARERVVVEVKHGRGGGTTAAEPMKGLIVCGRRWREVRTGYRPIPSTLSCRLEGNLLLECGRKGHTP